MMRQNVNKIGLQPELKKKTDVGKWPENILHPFFKILEYQTQTDQQTKKKFNFV